VVVKDVDLVGLEWQVDAGAVIRGHVVTKTGVPVDAAAVAARTTGGGAREDVAWAGDQSTKDGAYRLEGLRAGDYAIEVDSERGIGPKGGWRVTLASAGAVVDKDLVLDDGGTIRGAVVDGDGKPLAGVHVRAHQLAAEWDSNGSVLSRDDGTFSVDNLLPGEYRVTASKGRSAWASGELRKPGTDDDAKQGERTTVRSGQIANVRLVVEAMSGVIHGRVEDADGKPVTDVFISASRESDAAGASAGDVEKVRWSADDRPALSATDGSFSLDMLAPGKYTLLAQRKGGGEAIAEHVAVGASVTIRMQPTASVEGTVHRDGGAPDELSLRLRDDATGGSRSEEFFRTGGSYAIRDLPAGHYTITCVAGGGQKQLAIDLAEGEHKTGVDIELEPLATVTGVAVEIGTHKPVPGMYVMVAAGKSASYDLTPDFSDDSNEFITDDAGRFTLHDAPRGIVSISGWPKDWQDGEYGFFRTVREVKGTGTIDLGEIAVPHRRMKPGDPAGDLGVHFAQQPPSTALDERILKVSWIDPNGPAAKTDLRVGDIVVAIDGIDITGASWINSYLLMRAPPGTTLQLGVARGTTVAITLAPPA
jgi:hypothetical protein